MSRYRLLLLLPMLAWASTLHAQSGWRLDVGSAAWVERKEHAIVVFDDALWVIGGSGNINSPTAITDSWSSADGSAWANEVSHLPWSKRYGFGAIVFDDLLWVIGGTGTSFYNDVWTSDDGLDWNQVTPSAAWSARTSHTTLAHGGKIWVMGGMTLQSPYYVRLSDVWSSLDGINWNMEVAAASWSARAGHAALVFDGRMWVLGGSDGQIKSDVWSSTDGINWKLETSAAPWAARYSHQAVVYDGRIWVLGGSMESKAFNDVWSSPDGVNWTLETAAAPWSPRVTKATVFKDRIWVLGGADGQYRNDVWSYGLHIAPTTLPAGVATKAYSAALEAKEGIGPYTWEHAGGTLPPGLSLGTSTTELLPITGTPTAAGQFNFQIKLTDSRGLVDERTIFLTIAPAPKLAGSGGSSGAGCATTPQPYLPHTAAFAAALYALTRRRRLVRPDCNGQGQQQRRT